MSIFSSVRAMRPKRNKFDLSHEKKISANMGFLYPILLEEVVPGDSFRVNSEIMLRLAPMLAPIMHRVNVWTHFFFVPNRIIWNEWEDFITGGEDGLQEPVHPFINMSELDLYTGTGNLLDHLGIPPVGAITTQNIPVSALPMRAYQQIYNDYYRDQNLTEKVEFSKGSGQVTGGTELSALSGLRQRCWEKDYFTSALPWAQRGTGVTVPFSAEYKDVSDVFYGSGTSAGTLGVGGQSTSPAGNLVANDPQAGSSVPGRIENLDELAGIDINDLRNSNALQRWLELAARGGSRYIEQIRAFFGVTSSDARLQRPEYLGGGMQNVVISEVLQTSETGSTTPLADMAGHGVSVGQTNRFKSSFEEHGFIMGIMSVLPKTAYQQGIHRKWSRLDRFDYYFPQFAHLGEQEIRNHELYYSSAGTTNPLGTFGYQSRYAEYKFHNSEVAGAFRDTLNYWHMGRIFEAEPVLNGEFVNAYPTHRIFANTDEGDDKLWIQIYHKISALRPMPYYGTPRL